MGSTMGSQSRSCSAMRTRAVCWGVGLMAVGLLCLPSGVVGVPSALNVKTFSSVIKGGLLEPGGIRKVLCFDMNGTGVVNHIWFTLGGEVAEHAVLAFYIDNEPVPSIEFSPTVGLAGAAPEDRTTPWGTEFQGRTGGSAGEGVFNTRRIPFGTRIRVVATFAVPAGVGIQSFFVIIRGLEWLEPATFPGIVVGGLQLPPTARLKLYTTANVTIKALDYLTLANVSTGTGGMLHEVYMHANSTLFLFMEGCFRAFMDDADAPIFLSSGTEDYFNSANYFNAGTFRLPNSGLTYKDETSYTIAAYRNHERDPIVFQNGLRFVWRNSDEIPGVVDVNTSTSTPPSWICPITFPWNGPSAETTLLNANRKRTEGGGAKSLELLPVEATFLVWVYEWPTPATKNT
eukprot:m.109374 g.109374  ORF g.109374 m.109374 type:complete len:401 (+) comp21260_c0_seq2:1-1203(+)